ncbi:ribulokinase [Demequina flava]|uniref:ribulokinase n=1 Tax=Demequina flava TaxID=1095025 RepID=UPI0007810D6B|nr:ribulokinase [Demequina flava]
MTKYAIGVDFGTETCRAVAIDLSDGREVAIASSAYRHGVVDDIFPESGKKLPNDWALQYPADYLEALVASVKGVLGHDEINPEAVLGLGIDTTACTLIPVDANDVPLADLDAFRSEPHAYAKLWKDHSAQPQADRVNALAELRQEVFLNYYGGKVSAEWVLAKTLKWFEEAPVVFDAAERIYECGDWLVSTLVGTEARGVAVAGYKAAYQRDIGYPSPAFLEALSPGFSKMLEKYGHAFLEPGDRAGTLTPMWAKILGLSPETIVSTSNLDAHVAVLGAGVSEPGEMLLVMGTSVCNLMLSEEKQFVPGAAGVVFNGLIPGYWAYEAGQAGVGDTFGWFVRNFVPAEYEIEAESRSQTTFELLEERSAAMEPGESGIVALDWFNGNRSTLMDSHLSGLLVGLTLQSKPEHVYRALIESSAFGQRRIIEAFQDAGLPVRRIVACGGLPRKAPLLMQTLADVLNVEIEVSDSAHTPAVGAALHAAIAAGPDLGGFGSFDEAAKIASPIATRYFPNARRAKKFDGLYDLYHRLYEHFGNADRELMHSLRAHSS